MMIIGYAKQMRKRLDNNKTKKKIKLLMELEGRFDPTQFTFTPFEPTMERGEPFSRFEQMVLDS